MLGFEQQRKLRIGSGDAYVLSSSCSSRLLSALYPTRALQSRVMAPVMQPPAVSRSPRWSTWTSGEWSYPIYIGPGLLDEPKLLHRHMIGKRAQRRQEVVYVAGHGPLPEDQAKWSEEVAECGHSLNPIRSVPSPT